MFSRLRWSPNRVEHITRHGLTPEEVEEAVFVDPARRMFRGPRSEVDQTRFIYYVYGQTRAGRTLLIVLLDLSKGEALPITARDMTTKERRRYRG